MSPSIDSISLALRHKLRNHMLLLNLPPKSPSQLAHRVFRSRQVPSLLTSVSELAHA